VVDLEKMGARPHDVSGWLRTCACISLSLVVVVVAEICFFLGGACSAALLKQFLRDTPEPLLTSEYIEAFAATQSLEPSSRLLALQCLVVLLPPPNRACLEILLHFLAQVATRHEVRDNDEVQMNRMA
jgi:hypothetical protein